MLLVISMFHIMNSMNFLVLSRRHEFGILRAMGITDAGFMKMMVKEGILYGVRSGIVMIGWICVVKGFFCIFFQHVYLCLFCGECVYGCDITDSGSQSDSRGGSSMYSGKKGIKGKI